MLYILFIMGLAIGVVGVILFSKKADRRLSFGIMIVGLVLMFSSAPFIDIEEKEPAKTVTSEVDENESLDKRIERTIVEKLGEKTNMKKDRIHEIEVYGDSVVTISLNVDDNLTVNLAKGGMWRSTFNVLEELSKIKEVTSYQIIWMATFTDKFGNESEDKIMRLDFPRDIIDQINFENVDYNKAPEISENYWEHNSIR